MTRSILAVLAALALTLAACSGETPDPTPLSTAGSPTTALDVLATDALRFDPDQFTVPAGADITLTRARPSSARSVSMRPAATRPTAASRATARPV